jgi:(p)ppGpp synthase/HD superfamily hydrolase
LERTIVSNERYYRAVDLATEAHNGQVRKKSGLPYITHPMRVAHLCGIFCPTLEKSIRETIPGEPFRGGALCSDLMAVCLLHDVLEDTEVTEDEIADRLGPSEETDDIIIMVKLLTKRDDESKDDYLSRVVDHSPLAVHLKILDRIDNIRDATATYGTNALRRYLIGTSTFMQMVTERWASLVNEPTYQMLGKYVFHAFDRVLKDDVHAFASASEDD